MKLGSFAVTAPFGDEFASIPKSEKRIGALLDAEDHIAAPPTVAPVGAALGNILFAAKDTAPAPPSPALR